MAEISHFDPTMLVWVDESGFCHRNTIYSLQGMRATDHQLKQEVCPNSIGMSYLGMEHVYVLEDTVDGDAFKDFCR